MAAEKVITKPTTKEEALRFIGTLFAELAHTEGAVTETTVWPCLSEDADGRIIVALTTARILKIGVRIPITPGRTTVGEFLDACGFEI